ncbi:hypothetical protein BQ8794_50623 [Mesorhizobium prunaredense]|uniref:Arginine exporter protein ArgO n=1 Tax=Mesorhizobium prunaredense TaxID=1631249 RepID=A0A1R3VJC2_9HYPH|nr:hypothetical protein [Mesorhizobium prunaredense]SIT58521.1 hypothetical protein BQ8794_50623 [Mesorhizobium prunaredense]
MTADSLLSPAAVSGFVFGLGLVVSLGPQNLMLIQAGLTRSHPFAVASTGYVSEIEICWGHCSHREVSGNRKRLVTPATHGATFPTRALTDRLRHSA